MKLDTIVLPTLAGIFVMTAIYANYCHDRIKRYQTEVLQYQLEITNFKLEAEAQQRRYREAKEQADKELASAKDEVNHILASNVPKDCAKAMAWGVQQAKSFR